MFLPRKALRVGFSDGLFEDLGGVGEFLAHVDVGQLRVHGETGDGHALDQLMRVLMHDVAVLEGAGLGFVRVADEIDRLGVRRRDEAPLHARGESRTATTAKTAGFDLVGDGAALHLERLLELLVAAVLQVALDGGIVADAVDVFEDETLLARMRFFAGEILDGGGHGAQYSSAKRRGNRDL
jgi:hypothetical protein